MEEQKVEVVKKVNNNLIVVKDTPAWVCVQCGERYYSIETVKQIERILKDAGEKKIEFHEILAGEVSFHRQVVSA
ncbi:MAG: type II toxin-antitoxin system MqsA family antitoxin [Thermoplasmata archaeon]|nr:type II toxin-antitoxin system MqsA family antitoxin [Thermoplasmata archaeon]